MNTRYAGIIAGALWVAQAAALPFVGVSENNPVNVAIGEAQLSWDFVDMGGGQVEFLIANAEGGEASSVAAIYFDDNVPYLSFSSFSSVEGAVSFSVGATPGSLPSGNSIGFLADYSYGADRPAPHNGINPGEQLGITFDITAGYSFGDIATALNDGDLRIGLHVRSFTDGGSESFVNTFAVVPEPALLSLLGMGLLALGCIRRRH